MGNNEALRLIETVKEALEYKERYRWHIFLDDPKNLPKEDGEYYTAYHFKNSDKVYYYQEKFVCGKWENLSKDIVLIGWKEIEHIPEAGNGAE